jgi:hypothetical protein
MLISHLQADHNRRPTNRDGLGQYRSGHSGCRYA